MAKKDLTDIPTVEITAEIRRRQRRLPTLKKKREKLLAQIREIEQEMAEAKKPPRGAGDRGGGEARAERGRRGAPRGLRAGSMPREMLSYIAGQGPAGATSEDIHRQFSERTSSVSVPLQTLKKRGLVMAEKPTGGGRGYIYTVTREGKAALKS